MLISLTARLGLETPRYEDETHVDPHVSTSSGARTAGELYARGGASVRSARACREASLCGLALARLAVPGFPLRVALMAPSASDLEALPCR